MVWVGMYDVDYETKDYSNAIKRLKINPSKFKEDLTSLYMSTSQFDKALQLINELNESSGDRESYKNADFIPRKISECRISNLIDQIKSILKRNRITFR
jgi:hypothetical protein